MRLDASLHFIIIIDFHTKLKPQLKVSHDMNSLTHCNTLYTTFDQSWKVDEPTALIRFD